jgi:hypothetical protein
MGAVTETRAKHPGGRSLIRMRLIHITGTQKAMKRWQKDMTGAQKNRGWARES